MNRRDTKHSWAAALAAMVLTGLLATACGGGSSPGAPAAGGSSTAGGSTRAQAALSYAGCMRAHGVPDFPDPDAEGNFNLPSGPDSSQETAANQVCNHLLDTGTQLNAAQTQHALGQLVKYAQCMRAHGVPNFPDPQLTTGGIGVPGGFTFEVAGRNLDQKSPQYQAAARACQSLATHAKELGMRSAMRDTVSGPRDARRWTAAWAVVLFLAAGGVAAWRAGVLGPDDAPVAASGDAPPPATAMVTRQDLSASTPVTATLGYAGSYPVTGRGDGTLTWLPSAGQVIGEGQALYRVDNGSPVMLLYGGVPDWRPMATGDTGADVSQLNHDLVRLGYANNADVSALGWDYYSWDTEYGVRRLEEHLGVSSPPGWLTLGQVVFEPGALRVSQVTGSLGGQASGPVLNATSTRHVVTISLDAAQQAEVTPGDKVTVTLPDGAITPGVISRVGRVATSSGGSGGNGGGATIPVTVTLDRPAVAGSLDQAPVTVNITTGSARNALTVPVGALLAQSSGGYAVEVVDAAGTRRLVPVQAGPVFDDADGLVQVTGALTPGERVVVPAT